MLFNIEGISDFNFARIEKPVSIFEISLTDLNFSPNNITISKLYFFQLSFRLKNITISNLTVSNVAFNAKNIIGTYLNNIPFNTAIIFDQYNCFLLNDVVISKYNLFSLILTDY